MTVGSRQMETECHITASHATAHQLSAQDTLHFTTDDITPQDMTPSRRTVHHIRSNPVHSTPYLISPNRSTSVDKLSGDVTSHDITPSHRTSQHKTPTMHITSQIHDTTLPHHIAHHIPTHHRCAGLVLKSRWTTQKPSVCSGCLALTSMGTLLEATQGTRATSRCF